MVKVTYHRRAHRLTANGHAGSAEKGHDLVCTGVSCLVLTLASNVAELSASEHARHPIMRLREGDAWVSCIPSPGKNSLVTMVFDVICTGFELLQTLHPENIQYSIVE